MKKIAFTILTLQVIFLNIAAQSADSVIFKNITVNKRGKLSWWAKYPAGSVSYQIETCVDSAWDTIRKFQWMDALQIGKDGWVSERTSVDLEPGLNIFRIRLTQPIYSVSDAVSIYNNKPNLGTNTFEIFDTLYFSDSVNYSLYDSKINMIGKGKATFISLSGLPNGKYYVQEDSSLYFQPIRKKKKK